MEVPEYNYDQFASGQGCFSLAPTEVSVVLVDKDDTYSLSTDLEGRRWENIPVRDDEYLTGAPPAVNGARGGS